MARRRPLLLHQPKLSAILYRACCYLIHPVGKANSQIENELFLKLKKNMAKEYSFVGNIKEREAFEIIQKELEVPEN